MAKYKIVGIPKSLPKAQLGLFKKKKREPQEPMNNTVWSGVTPEIITPDQDPFSLPTMSPTPVAEIKLPDYTPEQIDDYRIRKEAQDRKLEKINAYAPKELTYKDLSRPKGSFVPGEDMTDELLTELKNSGYYPKKTPEGDYEIFSSKDVADLIYTKGLNPNELSTKLDLGDATELKTYFDPIYQNASMIHAKRNKEKIDNLIKTGLTKTQAIDQLVEEGEGTKSGLTKLYGDYTEKAYKARQAEAKKLLAAGAINPNDLTNYQKQNLLNIDAWVQEERDKQTGKDYIVLEDGSKILSPYAIHPNSILPSESTAIRNKVGAWTTDPATGKKQWVAPNNNTAFEEAQSQEFLHQQAIDNFNRTTALQAQAAKAILLEKNLTDEQRKKFLEDPKEFQKIYESYVNWVYAPEGSTTGYIQASGLPGQNQLKSDFNITVEGPKWSAGTNRKNAASGAVDMLDKEWIMGVVGGLSAKPIMGAVSSALSYAPIASAPWLTAGNALNAYFGYEAVRPGGNISKAVDAFSEGNIREGAVEAGWGALGLLPFVKPTIQGAQILKQLKTPGSIQVLPKSGNYSFLYKSPAEGGLLVGNPNLNGSEQVLTGVTEAFNKFSRAAGTSFGGLGLGEFKIMKQTPTSYGYASTVAEGMTLGDMATVGQTVKTTTPALVSETDDFVDLYRIEPAQWDKIQHPTGPKDPMLEDYPGVFYPYDTYGKWFEQDINRLLTGKGSTAPGTLLSNGADLNLFKTKVPKSKLSEYGVKGTPFELWSKSPDSEYIVNFDRATTPKITFSNTNEGWQSLSGDLSDRFAIDKLVENFRIPTQGSASVAPLDNQSILQKFTGTSNVQGAPSEEILNTVNERSGIANISGVTPEIESIYNSYPELNKIGTADEYAEYLKQTFPNSSAQDILYHVNSGNEVLTESGRPFYATQDQAWLAELEEMKGRRKPVLLNLERPTVLDPSYEFTDKAQQFRGSGLGSNLITPAEARLEGADGVIGRDMFQGEGRNTYVAFEPEQVLPLGTQKDAEMFKQWKESQTSGISAPLKDLNAEKELLLTDQLELQKKFEDGVIEFDEYVKTNDELTNKLNTVDEKLNTQKTKNIEALSDNEIATNVINDMRANKIELWQTEEGQKRLQEMIDNTPSLQGQTPDTLIEGMASMNNINNYYSTQLAQRNELLNEMSMYDKMYENGQISKSEYFNAQVELDEKLTIVDNNISELSQDINQSAFYGGGKNEIAITPGLFSKGELPKVTAHELGHFLGSYAGRKSGTTYLDEALKELDLVKSESKQLEIQGLDVAEESKAHDLFGNARPNYINETLKYFDQGSKGTERVPFLAEVRQDMLDKGLIKHEYDPITPDLLKKHYDQYKGMKGEKYPLRIYDIIKDKPKNFNIMSSVLNKLPMIVGTGLMLNELSNDDKDSNVNEAGLGLFLAFLSRNPNAIKTSKRLQGLVNNFTKYGNVALKELKMLDKRYLTKQINALEKEKTDIWDELGIGYNSPKGLTQRQHELIGKTEARARKFKDFLKMRDVAAEGKLPRAIIEELNANYQLTTTPEDLLRAQETKLNYMDKVGENFNITPEGLEKNSRGVFEGVTTTGIKPVTDLSTGQVVNAEVRLPGVREEYKLVNGKLVNTSVTDQQPIISPEYITALKNSRADVEAKIPGAKVFGSSVLVTEAGMPHITGDIDVIITQSDYAKNVKDKFGFVQDYGPAKQHAVYPQHGAEGTLDFNIIHEDANGMVTPFYNTAMPDKTPMEIELFRQFYPEKFQEAATKAMVSGKPIEINMTAKDFMEGINPEVKTVIDSYETSPFNKWGNYNPNKEKHILRPDVLIAYGNPEVVAKGQEAYIKSVVGPKGNLGHQFTVEQLSDVNKNVDALLKMDFTGDILQTAQDPKRMQLALNDYYINNTVFSREISAASLPGGKYTEDIVKTALTEWFPGKGGSVNGIGLNAVQKGNPTHIHSSENPVIGHRQLGLNLNTSDPVAYVESVIKGTSGNYFFTPEELKIVEELAEKYLPEVKSSIGENFKSRDILNWYPRNSGSSNPKKFLDELSEKTGIRAIRKEELTTGGYGSAGAAYASILGKFDEVMDAMMYSLKEYHASPKTLNERKTAFQQVKNKKRSGNYSLNTKEDFQRIYSILDGGRNTLQSRINQTQAQIEAANNYRDELIARLKNSDDAELEQLNVEISNLQDRLYNINYKDQPALQRRIDQLDKMYRIFITGGAAAGVVGLGYLGLEKLGEKGRREDRERKRKERKLKLSQEKSFKDYYKSEKNVVLKNDFLEKLPDIAQEWLLNDMWRDTWPTGEPYVINKNGYIEPPKKIRKISDDNRYEWILSFDDAINNDNEKKFGGEASMDLELTPEEIKDYISRGYLVYEK